MLGDAHRERRYDATVGLADHATRREIGRKRGVAHRLRESEPRVEDDALDRRCHLVVRAARGRLVLATRTSIGEHLERAIERLRCATELARHASCFGGAQEQVRRVLDGACVPGYAQLVATVGIGERVADHLRACLERFGMNARTLARVVGAGKAGLGARDALDGGRRRPCRAVTFVARVRSDVERAIDVARSRRKARHIDQQEPPPCRVGREVRASGERLFALRRVAELRRDELEGQPRSAKIARPRAALGRLACSAACAFEVLLYVLEEERALGERSCALFGRDRGGDERLDELAEVRERPPSLEESNEALERLAEAGVGVVRGEIVARGAGLVTAALLDLASLVEEASLPLSIGGGVDLGAQASDRGGNRLDGLDGRRRELRSAGDHAGRGRQRRMPGVLVELLGRADGRAQRVVRVAERMHDVRIAAVGVFADVDGHVLGRRFPLVDPLSFVRLFGHSRQKEHTAARARSGAKRGTTGGLAPPGARTATGASARSARSARSRQTRASSFSLTLPSIVPFNILSMNGRSIATRTVLSVTATSPFVPFAAPLGASKRIVSPSHFHWMPNLSAMPFASSSAFTLASWMGRVWLRVMSIVDMGPRF